jgi:radical SAM superfamily enzyme YgiQ (UPF0313 family)
MKIKSAEKNVGKRVAIINPIANIYAPHRKLTWLFSMLRTFLGINLFVSPTTLLLAAVLKKIGCHVKIYNDLEEKLDPGKVDEPIVLISIMTTTAKRGYEIAGFFRDRRVIIGGVHASLLPEEAIQHADQVVVGECERVMPDLIAGRIKKKIVYAEPPADLDDVPHLDYGVLSVVPKTLQIQTSRGCPFNCHFCCVSKVFGRGYRFRSPASVLSELTNYREKYGKIKQIDFRLDANFTCNVERAKEILRRMVSEGIKPRVTAAHTRLDVYKDRELLSLMSPLNFKVYIGMESLNQDALDGYNKKQQVSEAGEAIRVFHDHNIKVHGYFIFGADQDEPDTLKRYEEFAYESNLDAFTVTVLTPHPGTELHNQLASQKRIFTYDWDYYDGLHVTYKPARMSAYEMQKAFNEFYFRVFSLKGCLNPKLLFDMDTLQRKFFIGLLSGMLKKEILVYTDFLREQALTPNRTASF